MLVHLLDKCVDWKLRLVTEEANKSVVGIESWIEGLFRQGGLEALGFDLNLRRFSART